MSNDIMKRLIKALKEKFTILAVGTKLAIGNLKNGGWKGTALALTVTTTAIAPALVACVDVKDKDVEIEDVTDMNQIASALVENGQAIDDVVEDVVLQKMEEEGYTNFEGKISTILTRESLVVSVDGTAVNADGKKVELAGTQTLTSADFDAQAYTNATLEGNTLSYTQNGIGKTMVVAHVIELDDGSIIVVGTSLEDTVNLDLTETEIEGENPGENPGGETGGNEGETGGETGGNEGETGGETGGNEGETGGETGGNEGETGGETGGNEGETGENPGGGTGEESKDVVISKIENADMTALISNNVADFEEYLQLVVEGKIDQTVDGFAGDIDTAISNGTITISASGTGTQEGENVNVKIDETTLIAGDFAGTLYENAKVENGILVDLQGNPVENVDLDGRIVVETQNGVYVIEITPGGFVQIGVVVEKQNEGENPGENPGGETGEESKDVVISKIENADMTALISNNVADFEEYLQLVVEGKIDQTVDGFAGDINTAVSNGTITISASGAGTQEGENVNVNIEETTLIAGDFAGTLYANAKVENGILVDLQGNPVENVDLDGRIVVETQYGVYVIEITPEGSAEIGVVVEKQNDDEQGGETGGSEIIITSWNDVETNATLSTQVAQVLQDKLLTYTVLKSMFGNTISENALEDGSIQVFKWGFNTDGNGNLVSVDLLGCRHGFPMANTRRFMTATFTFESPISVSDITDKNNLNSEKFTAKVNGASYTKGTQYSINADVSLTLEDRTMYDSCMELLQREGYAYEVGLDYSYIQVDFGTSKPGFYMITLKCVTLQDDRIYTFNISVKAIDESGDVQGSLNAAVNNQTTYSVAEPTEEVMLSNEIKLVVDEGLTRTLGLSLEEK